MKTNVLWTWIYLVVMFVLLYCMFSMIVYWFKHPELTQMQLLLYHFLDAVLWR